MSWCLKDETDDYSESILALLLTGEGVLPSICMFEVANVLLVAERKKRITKADSSQFVYLLQSLPIHLDPEPSTHIVLELVALGRQYGLSAYDAAYLELAMREGLPMATRDKALRHAASKCGVKVI
jgi:predicted nucleic acid-binding protein